MDGDVCGGRCVWRVTNIKATANEYEFVQLYQCTYEHMCIRT